jgi:murein DD-endopeptidase MepM/ murein hydrolase activator NlpD
MSKALLRQSAEEGDRMIVWKRRFLAAALGIWSVGVGSVHAASRPVRDPVATIEAVQGTVVRWSVPGTRRCGMGGRSWAALQETCYYPIDMLRTPGLIRVSRQGVGAAQFAHISIGASSYGAQDIELGDIPQANPSAADLRRNVRDQALLTRIWAKREGAARFTLPLGAPAKPLPEAKGFGAKWVFNGKEDASEIHSGVDYALGPGTPLLALADGTVVVAQDLFFTGNAVFVDHGNGLVSMYFHLSEIRVQAGQDVAKGETIGLVGSTGRTTGPHLHMGVRWHNARIGPQALLDDPAKIPAFRGQ